MRHIATILVIAVSASLLTLPLARAADPSDSSTSPQGHVQQRQDAVPPSSSQKLDSRDQSAQVPQSRAVITPPSTGDKSVIAPPATGAAKTPVITPPGTAGNKDEIQPK